MAKKKTIKEKKKNLNKLTFALISISSLTLALNAIFFFLSWFDHFKRLRRFSLLLLFCS